MPLVATRSNAPASAYGFTSVSPEALGGMVLMTPTSIASAGTGNSSSIGTNGSVTFSSCTSLSLNGVFTSEYNNYKIVMRYVGSANANINLRVRASGTDATGSNYVNQDIQVDGTQVTAGRSAASTSFTLAGYLSSTQRSGLEYHVYGPQLAQPTAYRCVSISGAVSAYLVDTCGTHSLSTAYDGFTIFLATENVSGLISVYGLVGA